MIVTEETSEQPKGEVKEEVVNNKSENFLDKLVWQETQNGKWYLGARECTTNDAGETVEPEILTFDMGGYEAETEDKNKVESGNWVISELGKLKVSKVEEGQAFLELEGSEEPPAVPLTSVKKVINVNFLILGRVKNHLLENVPVNINSSIFSLKETLAEYLSITTEIMTVHFKDAVVEDGTDIHTLDINEGDTFLIGFALSEEIIYKRSTSKDYSWYDQKNFIPFTVDKPILVSALGFFRHTDSVQAIYDLFLYEVKEDGGKTLVLTLTNVKVLPSECDSNYVKRVPITPMVFKDNVKYYAYVYYKIADQRTYYAYYGTAVQTTGGVKFSFLDLSESGHRASSTSGHLPYIYFKLYNPYED